jgi:hypothetical protein
MLTHNKQGRRKTAPLHRVVMHVTLCLVVVMQGAPTWPLSHRYPFRMPYPSLILALLDSSFVSTMSSSQANAGEDHNNGITAPKRNESDVYDRQIRLWGADAQESLKHLRCNSKRRSGSCPSNAPLPPA